MTSSLSDLILSSDHGHPPSPPAPDEGSEGRARVSALVADFYGKGVTDLLFCDCQPGFTQACSVESLFTVDRREPDQLTRAVLD